MEWFIYDLAGELLRSGSVFVSTHRAGNFEDEDLLALVPLQVLS